MNHRCPHEEGRWIVNEFHEAGIRFKYPENWKLEREDTDDGWSVSLQSPTSAFMLLTLHADMPDANLVAQTALKAMEETYDDLEASSQIESIAGQPAVGHDMRFFSFDLTNTAWTRSFYTASATVMLLCQFNDLDEEVAEPVLRAICASLSIDD
ncbi:MAG: hypothetical protein KatS3mg105_0296 [Gemmatales bacterium]|nr:MAG: hypothetical protein KatS3mg105_0296 [Gemmatales bacterium]